MDPETGVNRVNAVECRTSREQRPRRVEATSELSRALGRSQSIVEKKSTMPILSHVLLEPPRSRPTRLRTRAGV
jgi:hypothetical protein